MRTGTFCPPRSKPPNRRRAMNAQFRSLHRTNRRQLYCSFCGKSQHEVRKLIAGPPPVFICDECADICTDVVEPDDDVELFRLMKAKDESGKQADRALFELARGTSTEELAHYVERSRRGVERSRLALQGIQRKLAVPDDDMLTLPPTLRDQRREDLVLGQQTG